jgi:hypothetical protein
MAAPNPAENNREARMAAARANPEKRNSILRRQDYCGPCEGNDQCCTYCDVLFGGATMCETECGVCI